MFCTRRAEPVPRAQQPAPRRGACSTTETYARSWSLLRRIVQGGYQTLNSDGFMSEAPTAEQGAHQMRADLLADARRRLATLQRYPVATQRRRLSAWLQRAGHDWGTTRDVLEELGL